MNQWISLLVVQTKVNLWTYRFLNLQKSENVRAVVSDSGSEEVFQAYVDIVECYNIHKDYYQKFVSTLFTNLKCNVGSSLVAH